MKVSNCKREDYISWEEYFMGIAELSAKRSKDPHTQVGACIIDKDNRILSVGYNGFPNNCSDDEFNWGKDKDGDNKYLYVVHAELNAILNYKGPSLQNSTLYVTLFPCNECTKAIIQSGIKEVIYKLDKHPDIITEVAAKKMLDAAGIKYKKYIEPSQK